jgi:hypothetical protein
MRTQKAFIQIPLLAIIVAIILVTSAGAGVFFYKQNKVKQSTSSISEAVDRSQDILPTEESQTNQQEEPSQEQKESEQAKLEIGSTDTEAEEVKPEQEDLQSQQEIQKLAEEQKKIQDSENYKKSLLEINSLVIDEHNIIKGYAEDMVYLADERTEKLNELITLNNSLISSWPEGQGKEIVRLFNETYNFDVKTTSDLKKGFKNYVDWSEENINAINNVSNLVKSSNELITEDTYLTLVGSLKEHTVSTDLFDLFLKQVDQYKEYTESKSQFYQEAFNELKNWVQSHSYQPQYLETTYYIVPSAQNSFLQNYYQQEQIRALNNISNQLFNIWNELSLPF